MEGFTYEFSQPKSALETYEWDNIWWEKPNDEKNKNRFLIIGDSISCGYRGFVNKIFDDNYYADGLGTSKSIDNAAFCPLIDYMLLQENNCGVIQFNNGLHGWHLGTDEYGSYYRKIITYLLSKNKNIIIGLTTPVRSHDNLSEFDSRNAIVKQRNIIAEEIAKENNLPVNDLYSLLENRPEYYLEDGVHLTDDGYSLLAKQTAELLLKYN